MPRESNLLRARKRKLIGTTRLPEMDSLGNRRQRGVEADISDADKRARTGSGDEAVRDTPPAGAWNDVAED